jgi:DNA-binding response OmpR family regulator
MVDWLEGLRVLVVEDDPIIALDVVHHLREAGADVIGPSHSVRQALRLIESSTIDAAVLDYRLETETATPVAHRLTALGVPFLFHTSSRSRPEVEHPGVPVIDKPTRPGQLVAAIKALTSKR